MSARYITQSLSRACISSTRRFSLANPPPIIVETKRRSSSSQSGSEDGGIYIDKILKELHGRGLREDSDIHSQDAFKLFQLEQKFLIDMSKLKKEMLKLQVLLHPDKFVGKDIESQQKSDHLSALVNEAYTTLKNPYKRAKYLLSKLSAKNADEIEHNLDDLKLDPDFLERMMELREKIDSCSAFELSRLHSELDIELSKILSEVNKDFRTKQYDSILNKLGALKFLANCLEAVEDRFGRQGNF